MTSALKVNKHGLVELNISGTSATEIPTGLYNFIRVEAIHARDNVIRELPETFGNLRRLQVLDLRNNKISILPSSLHLCDKLRYVDAGNNHISDLPVNFGAMKQLKYLSVGGNSIRYFGEEITSIKSLEYLDISHNKLQVLPYSVQELSMLRVIDLSYNSISELPNHVYKLKQLQVLDIKYNNLTKLPSVGGMWPNMKELNLAGNGFSSIPPSLAALKNLMILNMANNNIKHTSGSCLAMRKLKNLCLDGNHLCSINSLPPSLEHLSISNNNLRVVTLQNLVHLEYADCSKNRLEYLPIGLEDCRSLKTLLLKSNGIREVPADTCHMPSLEVVDLGDNLLERPPPLKFTKNLQLFNVQGNKFNKGMLNQRNVFAGMKQDRKVNSLGLSTDRTTPTRMSSSRADDVTTMEDIRGSSSNLVRRDFAAEDVVEGRREESYDKINDDDDVYHARWVETTQVHQTSDEFVLTPIGGRFPVPQTNISIEFAPGAIGKTTHFSLKAEVYLCRMLSAFQADAQLSRHVRPIQYMSPLIHVGFGDTDTVKYPIKIHIPIPASSGYLHLLMVSKDSCDTKYVGAHELKQDRIVTINCQQTDLSSAIGVVKTNTSSSTMITRLLNNFFNAVYA